MLENVQLGLDRVRIDKAKLIAKLKENLAAHKIEYAEVHEAWKGEVILAMKENLRKAQEEGEFNLFINLNEPVDHSKDYRNVISLLEASVDEVLVITAKEFRQYHDDEWSWSELHKSTMRGYQVG